MMSYFLNLVFLLLPMLCKKILPQLKDFKACKFILYQGSLITLDFSQTEKKSHYFLYFPNLK